jgi:hypothetical protein
MNPRWADYEVLVRGDIFAAFEMAKTVFKTNFLLE